MSSRARAYACAAIVAAVAFSTYAAAQDAPDPNRNIVVRGERPPATEAQVTEQAQNVSIVGNPLDEPLPRFEDRVCPGVLGLTEEAAGYINQRIRYNAEQFDLRIAPDDGTCEPNFIVAFVDDAQNALVEVARRNGYLLAGLSVTERGELLNAPGAARVWSNVMSRTRDGMPVPSERDARGAPERAGSTFAGTDGAGNPLSAPFNMGVPPVSAGWNAHSKIYVPTRDDIVSVLVLFDRAQVRGKSLLQLADYATMRDLALTRETSGEHPAPTILSLFDGDGPHPDRLTPFDLGYLGSLYRDLPNIPAQAKIAGVNAEMQRQASRE
jgi:hypothetical protein